MTEFIVSVIIPTYQDWARLRTCLDALEMQTLETSLFEVIVANNDPSTSIPKDISFPTNFTLINVSEPGSYAARNAALDISKGSILAFTDADCVPEPDWLSAGVNFFYDNHDITRIAGGIHYFVKGDVWTAAALYDRTHMLQQDKFALEGKSATANAFMRRAVFEDVGKFNPKLLTGGDMEWSLRAKRAGYKLAYCPESAVKHPARSNLFQLFRKARRFAGGSVAKKRSRGDRLILPYFDNFLPPIRQAIRIFNIKDLKTTECFKVWLVLYSIRIVTVFEQIRLLIFQGKYERR